MSVLQELVTMDIVGALTFAMLVAAHVVALATFHELDYTENFRRRK